jgi:hypothetical protein
MSKSEENQPVEPTYGIPLSPPLPLTPVIRGRTAWVHAA